VAVLEEKISVNLQAIADQYRLSVDEVRQRWLALRVAYWKSDFKLFARDIIRIRDKEASLVPLVLNEAQTIVHDATEKQLKEEGWVRLLCLKGRRQGFSTLVAARGYWKATLWQRQRIYILSHEMASSNVLFDMVNLMQEHHPFAPALGADNAKELEFVKLGSSYVVATAGQKAGGRGGGVSFFHGSEAAYWVNAPDHFASSVQAVDEVRGQWGVLWQRPDRPLPFEQRAPEKIEGWVKAPSEIFLETTSAGPTGEFYSRYMDAMKGIGRYRHVFALWTMQKENNEPGDFVPSRDADEGEISESEYQQLYKLTDSQMLWRRSKIHELGSQGRFQQEYPIDIAEAFSDTDVDNIFIKPQIILKARKRELETPDAPLIIGVDPAGAGGDRFAIVWRRGDKVIKVRYRKKLEHDEAVAWLSSIIDEDKPDKMCIDRGSMGANILSSLRALGPKYAAVLKGVDFGSTSKAKLANPKRAGPWNIRAEIWGRMREWLIEGGVIPDDDDLVADLTGPKIKYRANNDWLLESKTEMKARGIRSSDLADALALTFAVTEFFAEWSKLKKETGWGRGHNGGPTLEDADYYSNSPNGWMG
jgi:hypothetical protein